MKTIKSSAEISRLFKEGKRINAPEFSLIVARTEGQHDRNGRVAFIAGKKFGNAVWRNRAKRRMRETCRALEGPFPGYDVAFVARAAINDKPYSDLLAHARKSLVKAGIVGNG